MQRVTLLQYGDDPQIEPGDLWVRVFFKVARIRERPAYAKLSERARELDELKAQF